MICRLSSSPRLLLQSPAHCLALLHCQFHICRLSSSPRILLLSFPDLRRRFHQAPLLSIPSSSSRFLPFVDSIPETVPYKLLGDRVLVKINTVMEKTGGGILLLTTGSSSDKASRRRSGCCQRGQNLQASSLLILNQEWPLMGMLLYHRRKLQLNQTRECLRLVQSSHLFMLLAYS